jgi:hypothetical protein
MKKLLLLICAGLLLTACGGGNKLTIKYDGKEIPFEAKSGWITAQEALYGSSAKVSNENHCLRWITLRNYDYQVKSALSANEGSLSEGQIKLFLSFHDQPGTTATTPLKPAAYNGANEGPMEFEFINLTVFEDGKEVSRRVSLGGQDKQKRKEAEVKILSVTDDAITGEVNADVKVDGKELLIKGPFTAKIFKN